eukprot:snap_masked-scaffold_1-processed-gene-22.37-mRNA-1 protein AED:1.00 eAED:1.00 QI:0/-1/0/0/-1/1/1/0/69
MHQHPNNIPSAMMELKIICAHETDVINEHKIAAPGYPTEKTPPTFPEARNRRYHPLLLNVFGGSLSAIV